MAPCVTASPVWFDPVPEKTKGVSVVTVGVSCDPTLPAKVVTPVLVTPDPASTENCFAVPRSTAVSAAWAVFAA